jgi:sporulation protein YlmC with PRC-barrel domain
MKIKAGTGVFTPEGERIGDVARVVLHPDTKEITHVVVRGGHLLSRDRLIPIESLNAETEDRLRLTESLGTPNDLPEFEAEQYYDYIVRPDHGEDAARPLMYVPPSGLDWHVHIGRHRYPGPIPPERHFLRVKKENVPEGEVPLRVGAHVLSADGKTVGRLEEVITDGGRNWVTHLVISEGHLFAHRKAIPAFWVEEIQEDRLRLSMPAQFLQSLPDQKNVPAA